MQRTLGLEIGTAITVACVMAGAACAQVTEQKVTPAPKSTTQKFPYPGEEPAATADAPGAVKRPQGYENEKTFVPDAPEAKPASKPAGGAKTPPPYPGDPDAPQASASPAAGRKTPPPYPGDPDAPGSSSAAPASGAPASDGFSSSSVPGTGDDAGPLSDVGSSGDEPEPDARKHPVRKKLVKVDPQTPESRETEDLNVAEFYQKSGNFAGAYSRAKDAVATLPDDPFAHLALADAARKLGKTDEAQAEYAQVLKLDPAPKEKKAAQKALAELPAKK